MFIYYKGDNLIQTNSIIILLNQNANMKNLNALGISISYAMIENNKINLSKMKIMPELKENNLITLNLSK